MAKKLSDYKNKDYSAFPSDRMDPKNKKKQEWFIAVGSAMLHRYMTNQYAVPHSWGVGQTPFSTLRMYREGKQGNISVKKKLLRESDEEPGKFKTKLRDVFQTYDVLPELLDVVSAINQKQDYTVSAIATDDASSEVREKERGLVKYLMQEEVKQLLARSEYKPETPVSMEDISLLNEAEVDTLFDTGLIQLQREIAAVAAAQHTMDISNHKEIENKCNEDLITLAIAAVKNYIDYSTGEVKERYVDPANLILPYSKYNDFRDAVHIGELRTMTIAEIKEVNPNLTGKQLRELAEDHRYMNSDYSAYLGNVGATYSDDPSLTDPIDNCKVWVLDYQWLSADYNTYLEAPTSNGGELYKKVDYGYELNSQQKKKGAKVESKRIIKKYSAIWIVGTEILLQYGEDKDQAYYGPKGNKTPKLDYTVVKTGTKSIVERCIPMVDDINLNNVKMRIAVASLPPAPRMVIQQQMLNNVRLGGVKQKPTDLIHAFLETGFLIVNGLNDHGQPIYQNGKALDFVGTGLGEDITIYSNLINDSIARMRQVIGLPEGLDGTAPMPYQGVRTQEMAASASSNALFPTIGRIGPLFTIAVEQQVKMWQVLAKGGGKKVRYKPLGERTWKVLELTDEFWNSDFNFSLTFAPTEEQKQFLLQRIANMKEKSDSSGGQVGITESEFLMLYKMIQGGQIDKAMFRMAQIEKRKERLQRQQQLEEIQMNAESQREANIAAEDNKRQTIRIEEEEKRKTAIVTGAQQRKTGISNTFLKSFEGEDRSIPEAMYQELMADADGEIAAAMAPEQEEMDQQMPQEQMMEEGAEPMMEQMPM